MDPLVWLLVLLLMVRMAADLHAVFGGKRPFGAEAKRAAGRSLVMLGLLLVLPTVVVGTGLFDATFVRSGGLDLLLAAMLSLGIVLCWYAYLAWLDRFEPERRRHALLVFVLGGLFAFAVFPLSPLLERFTGLHLTGDLFDDWWYAFIVIGGLEEAVKILPVLLVMRFTRWVDEPFDHLFYAGVSALGFAFVENTLYLEGAALHSVGARAMLPTVMHMFNTSLIAYGLAIIAQRGIRRRWYHVLGLWVVASASHGFYDLWLIGPQRPGVLTFIFFFLTVQVWVRMKNNLLNVSPYMAVGARLENVSVRLRVLNGLFAVYMAAFVLIAAGQGKAVALRFLGHDMAFLLATLILVSWSFSAFVLVRGHVGRVLPEGHPLGWILPRIPAWSALPGEELRLMPVRAVARKGATVQLSGWLPVNGLLEEHALLPDGRPAWVFKPARPVILPGMRHDRLLIADAGNRKLDQDRNALVEVHGIQRAHNGSTHVYRREDLSASMVALGRVSSRRRANAG